jgi:hypothetical protein
VRNAWCWRDAMSVALVLLLVSCATTESGPDASVKPEKKARPAVSGETFLRGENRTILADEVRLELPLFLEAELFLAGSKVRRGQQDGKKIKEALGMARAKFAEGLEIRETHRILVTLIPGGNTVRLVARGHVVLIDQAENRVVRDATAIEVNGDIVLFHGPYQDGPLTR